MGRGSVVLSRLYLSYQSSDKRLICSSSVPFPPLMCPCCYEVSLSRTSPLPCHHRLPSQSSATIIFAAIVRCHAKSPILHDGACWFPFLFVWDTLAATRTHTQKTPVTMYLCLRRDALPILANLRGALITLCLLALVNTMTTWQRLKNPKHCYYFPIQQGEDTEHNPHCWPQTHQCVICRADVEKKKKKSTDEEMQRMGESLLGSGLVSVWLCHCVYVQFNGEESANFSIFFQVMKVLSGRSEKALNSRRVWCLWPTEWNWQLGLFGASGADFFFFTTRRDRRRARQGEGWLGGVI